jgi:predicted ArsR family transcriptional regulator
MLPPREVVTLLAELTHRELQLLCESSKGRLRAEIADALFLSEETVKTHRYHILNKWLLIIDEPTAGGRNAFRQMLRRVAPFLPPTLPPATA